ncbi:MAG: PIN domain-containing protein [Actinomycetes bacterium]
MDTHALVWWLAGDPMQPEAVARGADPHTLVVVSAATVWEIAVTKTVGKLRIDGSVVDHVSAAGFEPLAISLAHAERDDSPERRPNPGAASAHR